MTPFLESKSKESTPGGCGFAVDKWFLLKTLLVI